MRCGGRTQQRAGPHDPTRWMTEVRKRLARHLRGRAADDQLGLEEQLAGGTTPPWICADRSSTAARPMASMGWRTAVSGGSVQFMNAESS